MRVIISSQPRNLTLALAGSVSATVEAEYGDVTVKGSVLTLAHHGANAGNPCPCSYPNTVGDGLFIDVIGVSHADLDTLGGVLAIQNWKPEAKSFWDLAEFVDLNGAHKLRFSGASEGDLAKLHAWWAWNEANKLFAPRDGSVADVTEYFERAGDIITRIIEGDAELLAAGEQFKQKGEALNAASFKRKIGDVVFRVSDNFTNHLYETPDGELVKAVVAYNQKFRSVTVSFADTDSKTDACKFVQANWGKLAGGHKGIAGSPRGRKMTQEHAEKAAKSLAFLMSR